MKTREEAQRHGDTAMGCGCPTGFVLLALFVAIEVQNHSRPNAVTQIVAVAVFASILVFLYGAYVRVIVAPGQPTASEVAQVEAAKEREKRLAAERVAEEARRKEQQAKWAAEQVQQERKKAEEERRRQEQAERDRLDLQKARDAHPNEW